jgi:hypothetical protein
MSQPAPPRSSRTTTQKRTGPGIGGAVHSTEMVPGWPVLVVSVERNAEREPSVVKNE